MTFVASAVGSADELTTHLENSFSQNFPQADEPTKGHFNVLVSTVETMVKHLASHGEKLFQVSLGGHGKLNEGGVPHSMYASVTAVTPPPETMPTPVDPNAPAVEDVPNEAQHPAATEGTQVLDSATDDTTVKEPAPAEE